MKIKNKAQNIVTSFGVIRKVRNILLVVFCVSFTMFGCFFNANEEFRLMAVKATPPTPNYDINDDAIQKVAKGANDFAFRLSASLLKNNGGDNFVCSPYSVWMPLAALLNSTDAEYKPELLKALGANGISEADVNRAASSMLYDLSNDGENHHDPLKIVNAIFVDNNMTLKKDFVQSFADYYRGNVANVDFASKKAVDAVNKWASQSTDGLIKNVVNEFDPNTVAAIANSIYFSDRWVCEFNPEETKEDVFHAPNGETTASYMLREGDGQCYYEDDKLQATKLDFASGGGMYILLPKDGDVNTMFSGMTDKYFNEIQEKLQTLTGKLLLPRFSIENDVEGLKDSLIALGVPLFDEDAAPLTGGLIEETIPLFVSDAIQKSMIKVDEKGTTAAAVTVMVIEKGLQQPTTPFEMICNRPFAFVLYDYTLDGGDQVLFTGVVNQP